MENLKKKDRRKLEMITTGKTRELSMKSDYKKYRHDKKLSHLNSSMIKQNLLKRSHN